MRRQVLVRRAALVVAWEDGVELDDAVGVGGLQAAQEGRVEAALTGSCDAAVNAGCVGLEGELVGEEWLECRGPTAQTSISRLGIGAQLEMSTNCISR